MNNRMIAVVVAVWAVAVPARIFAHDEGHGPKLTDQTRQGGVLSPVIDKKESARGAKAEVFYKGELVRSEDGTVRVYLYSMDMNPLDLSKLDARAEGIIEIKKKGKHIKTPFKLTLTDDAFVGKIPKPSVKPFNIDVVLKEGDRELLVAFDDLD